MARLFFVAALVAMSPAEAASPMRFAGHGGPICSIFVSEDGQIAMTASFDYSLISWTIDSDGPRQRFRFTEHNSAVNDVAIARLFDEGPDVVTPGSKMPLQRLKDVEHRDVLISYLKIATAPENSAINESTSSPVSEPGAQQQE